jgi:CHAT domain-containing protein
MCQRLYPREKYPKGHADLARALAHLGLTLKVQGEPAEAEALAREALAMRQALFPPEKFPRGHPDLAASLALLGNLFAAQGDYGAADPYVREALEMRQALYPKAAYPLGHPDLAVSLGNLATLRGEQGEFRKAELLYRQALEMCRALYPPAQFPRGHRDLATCLDNLAGLHKAQEEYDDSEKLFREALKMRQAQYPRDTHPKGHPLLALSLNNLGTLHHARANPGGAEAYFREALEINQRLYPKSEYPRGHLHLASGLNNLGAALQDQGEYDQAEQCFRQALEMTQALYPQDRYELGHPSLASRLHMLGVLAHVRGDYRQAESYNRAALQMYTRLANRLAQVAPEPMALNAVGRFPASRDTLLSGTAHLPGTDERTYEAVWHSRSALTRVYQRRHLALIAAATDDSVRKSWEALQTLRRQREQMIMMPVARDTSDQETRLTQLAARIDAAERQLLPQLPALTHHEDLARLGPDALRQRLPGNTAVIDFLRYTYFEQDPKQPGARGEKRTARYLAFVVSRQGAQRVELGPAAPIEDAVLRWREAITARLPGGNEAARRTHEAGLAQQGRALRALVWEPVEKRLPRETTAVYLAPDSLLTQLPWAALPGKDADRVLLDDYALAVLPHAPFFLEQLMPAPPRSARRPPAPEGLLLVGGIRFDEQPAAATVATRGAESVVEQKIVWDYLRGTDEERKLVAKVLQAAGPILTANLTGRDATTGRLRQELERCRYAHLGTHGFFADPKFRSVLQLNPKLFEASVTADGVVVQGLGEGARSPLVLGGLVCAGANLPDTPERGILSGDAIAGLLLDDLQLAVLSACDTGIGNVAGGEGVFNQQRAFHIAGCKNVIASLWKVDDAATAALMVRFYGHLFADKQPPIEALRRAQLELYRHPELIPAWAKGEQRAPGKARPANSPAPPETPAALLTSDGRAPIRLWAAFTLSGLGR